MTFKNSDPAGTNIHNTLATGSETLEPIPLPDRSPTDQLPGVGSKYLSQRKYREIEVTPEAVARFWSKVEKTDGCWIWQGTRGESGHGQFWTGFGNFTAQRVSYTLANGPIPSGLVIDHLCRVPPCVNPDHLEAVTMRENLLRGETITAHNAAKTHCVNGHLLDDANIYWDRGSRECRVCKRRRRMLSMRRTRARKRFSAL